MWFILSAERSAREDHISAILQIRVKVGGFDSLADMRPEGGVESKITPRLHALGEGETMVPSMVSAGMMILLRMDLVPLSRSLFFCCCVKEHLRSVGTHRQRNLCSLFSSKAGFSEGINLLFKM